MCDRATAICRVFRGIIASVFRLEGYLKATIIAFCITLPQPPMIAELLNRLA
jgi:hypothetical protein